MLDLKDLEAEEADNFETHNLPAYQDTHIPHVFQMCMYTFLMNTYDSSHMCTCIKFKILQKHMRISHELARFRKTRCKC